MIHDKIILTTENTEDTDETSSCFRVIRAFRG
jgi:hypothetical protein